VTTNDVARRLASLYDRRGLRAYVRWKVRSDPAYEAVLRELRGHDEPLIDLGCGVGLLPFFLRENGFTAPITGIDFDQRKIEVARRVAPRYRDVGFIAGDARQGLPSNHNVVMLDILHYLDAESQKQILANVAALKSRGLTVLLVEQRAHAALAIADRAYVLETGSVTLQGKGSDLLKDPKVRAAYLGTH